MPRIDPLQLLRCLSVLLSPTGGIKSKDEVQRLASLMTKFSKKLVSKCIYIQILKTTKTDLLGMFMAAGGWNLTHTWLSDAIVAKNWPLIQELLELLLMCPVDVERLKANNCPKLIKGLSRDSPNESVKLLASKLVEQWLKIVKGETEAVKAQNAVSSESKPLTVADVVKVEPVVPSETVKVKEESNWNESKPTMEPPAIVKPENIPAKHENIPAMVKIENLEPKVEIQKLVTKTDESGEANAAGAGDAPGGQLPVYKITIKDGKGVLAKVISGDKSPTQKESSASVSETEEVVAAKPKVSEHLPPPVKKEDDDVKVNAEPQKVSSAKPKVKPDNVDSTKTIKEVSKKSKDSQNSSKLDRDKKSSKEKSRDKEKERNREKSKDRDKDRENSKVKDKKSSSSSSLYSDKGNGISEKDKATLAKLIPPAISKLGKIPKKPRTEESAKSSQSPTSESKKPVPSEVRKPVPPPEPPVSKKPSISIETRKLGDPSNRPKTVKTFNSKFRSTGLEEEAKPPPSRVKKPAPLMEKKAFPPPPLKVPSLKRPSPPKEMPVPEKKLKASVPEAAADDTKKEKTGGIKLIPPRPKPSFLQESDMFMDALTASTKKEPRKRKRRISSSKDGPETKKESPSPAKEGENNKDSTPPSSPQNNEEIKSPPIFRPLLKFYQDTMETNEEEKEEETAEENEKFVENEESAEVKGNEETEKPPTPTDSEFNENDASKEAEESEESEEQNRRLSKEDSPNDNENSSEEVKEDEVPGKYPKGVLIYHKLRKGPKKSVRWKAEKELETIKYFELDETERVNVTKTFMDMKQIERSNEREGFLLARKLPQDDIMEEKTTWQPLIPHDLPPCLVEPGSRSREKDVQYAREKITLQALYFSRSMIPDTAAEPDLEIHPTTDPTIIPLDDVTGNPDSVNDFQNTPWPEPKPMIIPQSPPPEFQQPQPPFNQFSQNTQGFQGSGPPQMFPPNHQGGMPNNMPPVPMPNNMGPMNNMPPSGGGDWRTGDGKVVPVNEMPMQMDMYGPGGPPPMGMGMPGMPGMGGPGPEMNFGMMPGEEMGPGGPFPPHQGFPMGGGPPPPGMFPYQGGNSGGGGGRGVRDMRRGRGAPRGNGPWFQSNGPHWQGGRGGGGGGGRGGRGNWGGQNRALCKHFRGGYCRTGEKCPFLHPGVNGPSY